MTLCINIKEADKSMMMRVHQCERVSESARSSEHFLPTIVVFNSFIPHINLKQNLHLHKTSISITLVIYTYNPINVISKLKIRNKKSDRRGAALLPTHDKLE